MARRINISKQRLQELIKYLMEEHTQTKSDWSKWVENTGQWQRAYRNLTCKKKHAWQANFHMPITSIGQEQMHSQLLKVTDVPDLWYVGPTERGDVRAAENIQHFMNSYIATQLRMAESSDMLAHLTCFYGRQPVLCNWRRQREKVTEGYPIRIADIPGGNEIEAVALHQFQKRLKDFERIDAMNAKIKVRDERGMENWGTLEILKDEDREEVIDGEIEFEASWVSVVKDGVRLEFPEPGDFLVSCDSMDVHDGDNFSVYTRWPGIHEVEENFRSDHWREHQDLETEPTKSLLEEIRENYAGGGAGDAEAAATPPRREADDTASGQRVTALMRRRICHSTFFLRWDIDGDGHREKVIVETIIMGSRYRIVRIDHLRSVMPKDDRWPFELSDFIYLNNAPTAIGVPELISPIQSEVNFIHNQRADAGQIRMTPFFFYDQGSSITPQQYTLEPGKGYPINGQVSFPSWGGSSNDEVNREMQLMAMSERILPIGDVPSGRNPGSRVTATGTAILRDQSNSVWGKFPIRFGRTIGNIGHTVAVLYSANMPVELEFRVTGKPGTLIKIKRNEFNPGLDFTIHASSLMANAQQARESAELFFQVFSQDPFFQQSPARMWRLRYDLIRSRNYPDPMRLLGPEPTDGTHPHLTPTQEQGLFQQDIPHDPHLDEDHERFIEAHRAYIASAESSEVGQELAMDNIKIRQDLLDQASRQQAQGAIDATDASIPTPGVGGPQQTGAPGGSPLPQDLAGAGGFGV